MLNSDETKVQRLGPCEVDSPMLDLLRRPDQSLQAVDDDECILFDDRWSKTGSSDAPATFELAGPREKIYFDPAQTKAGIVTCGGLCPGLNDVIRALVMMLWHRYGVKQIEGFRYGYQGLNPDFGHEVVELYPHTVSRIHEWGGTILGSSRGPQPDDVIVKTLVRRGINILFVIGGDGTLRGGRDIANELAKDNHKISVIGIPKTIDNDIMYVESFGFQTAVTEAVEAIKVAHTEAVGTPNGIGLVKLMGRDSGFIACHSAIACNDVNFVLIPEVPAPLEGEFGLLHQLRERLAHRQHAVIVVAEGAGQQYFDLNQKDKSGNIKFGDIGLYLKDRIARDLTDHQIEHSIKYVDPSYMIRGVAANPADSLYCFRLASFAVHAAMTGRTSMVVGNWHERFVHLPIDLATKERKKVDRSGDLWLSVLEATGQPCWRKDNA